MTDDKYEGRISSYYQYSEHKSTTIPRISVGEAAGILEGWNVPRLPQPPTFEPTFPQTVTRWHAEIGEFIVKLWIFFSLTIQASNKADLTYTG